MAHFVVICKTSVYGEIWRSIFFFCNQDEAEDFMAVKTGVKDEVATEEHEAKIEDEDCSGWVLCLGWLVYLQQKYADPGIRDRNYNYSAVNMQLTGNETFL